MTNYDYVKRWRGNNKGKVNAQSRRRYAKHRVRLSAYRKQWKRDNTTAEMREADRVAKIQYRKTEQYKLAAAKRSKKFKDKQELILVSIAGRPRPESCELCGNEARTVFDHCHTTGKFRGWLCDRCNRTLGQVKDSAELLLMMMEYLKSGGFGHVKIDIRRERSVTGISLCPSGQKISTA